MTSRASSIRRRNLLLETPLFIEGFTRAGKFLLGNLLSAVDVVDQYQYVGLLEHLPVLARRGMISQDVAASLTQTLIDTAAYDLAVGRNLNFRPSDKSFVANSEKAPELQARLQLPPPTSMLRGRYYPFLLHDCAPFLDFFLGLYSQARIVRLERSPMSLVGAWLKRGWGSRWGVDPVDLSICVDQGDGPVPLVASQIEGYLTLNATERVVASLLASASATSRAFEVLPDAMLARIYAVQYEDLCREPALILGGIADFLGGKIEGLAGPVRREGLPRAPVTREPDLTEVRQALRGELADAERYYSARGTLVGWVSSYY